ncbi:PAN2-PAN3 deadenylation complex catalytic subunit Pan2 isoform X2 [Aplysia californica]|uniref:PAN2-PAN3 deadenylation complex catalytic subunit PAN2 n=1 Tax=Aplysia californica TaxID=6500 RepID=A0ABM1A9N3_APLCA|nr:PAN2-PAN3 deadenylation complex catalytic subunit Pan2 isoform X2 [Aplysia californica]
MDFPGMPGYRPPHPQDPQNMPPPPPPNFQPQGMPREQGMGGGQMFQNAQQMPPRMPPGYPPMTDPHMPSGFPIMPGQEQGMPMGYQSPGHMQNPGMPPGYHGHMGNPMASRPPQNMQRFRQGPEAGPNMPPQSFHPQQQPPPSQGQNHQPPQQHQHPPQHRGPYHQGHSQPHLDYHHQMHHQHQPHPRGGQAQQPHPHGPMPNDFHQPGPQGGGPSAIPEFHPQQQPGVVPPDFHHPMQQNSVVAEYHPGQRQNADFVPHDQGLSHHDFRHGNRDHPSNMMGGYMDHNSMGLQGMMNDHGLMGHLDGHMLGGGDAYSQHQMMQMFGDPTMPEMRDGEFIPMGCQVMDKVMHSSVTCVNFDGHQELVWTGNQRGYVASYHGTEFQKYSAYRVSTDEDVRMNLSFPQGVLTLTPSLLRGTLRRGIPVFAFKDAHLHDMQCMMMRGNESVLIGGHHKQVLEVDIIRNCLSNVYEVKDAGIAIFRHTDRFICGGDSTGKVTVYDSKTMRPEHTLDAHSSCLSDFDIHDNLLITCGFSNRMNALTPDRLLRVYDMRVMRAMAPIQVSMDPTFLRFVPSIPNHIVVVSQMGSFQLVETISGGPPSTQLAYPVNTQGAAIIAFDISSTYQALCFGDSSGNVHLFAGGQSAIFNQFSVPVEFADPVDQLEPIDVNDELAAYSGIPMPYPAQGPLVSDFPEEMMNQVYRKPVPIDPEILRTMKVYQNIGYAPNTTKQKRNVIPYDLSEKGTKDRKSSVPESPSGRGDDPFMGVPKRYRRVEIKYSKLGVEDFDFRHYNKTNLAGLEPHIPNAYCNSMLQVLYYLEPLRCALLGHVCEREFCLSCELGFLFHMLDSQKGNTCQATNFLRAFRTMPQVSALGLVLHDIDENCGRVDFPRLIQSWQRFVLMQIHEETCVPIEVDSTEGSQAEQKSKGPSKEGEGEEKKKGKKKKADDVKTDSSGQEGEGGGKNAEGKENNSEAGEESQEEPQVRPFKNFLSTMTRSIIRDLLGIKIKSSLQCKCGLQSERIIDGTHINLMYPDYRPIGPNSPPLFVTFAEVVQNSMTPTTNIQAWCSDCNRYQHHCQRKCIQNLPDVLALNCHTENEKNLDFWKAQFQIVRERFSESDIPTTVIRPANSHATKKCRFGVACHRPDCIFFHDGPRECDSEAKKKPVEDDEFGPSWIPMGLKVIRNPDGTVVVSEISDEEPLPSEEQEDVRYYELYSVVSNILHSSGSNLVCCLKVGERYHQRKERVTCTQWYLINDFCITPVEKDEAVDFKLDWNVPCIIHYTRRNFVSNHDVTVKSWSSPDILFNDAALLNPERRKITFPPLQPEELPKQGDIVALDAEFVSLKEEEAELRSDGTRSTIIPSQMSVARITCIRGSGPNQGEPFIDDYISTQEQVVDYLTQYSGIKSGDLDPATSTKHLTTLKSTYLKLRYLVDNGVVFIGHGLKKDFRVINLLVPKAQVMDTVELYHLPRQRYISLKFLAWYFLKINIQSYTHDSAEDARTALQLCLLYKDLQKEDKEKVLSTIKEMYEAGRKISWKIPDVAGEEISEADFL